MAWTLNIRIAAGLEDTNLLAHIDTLTGFRRRSFGEQITLKFLWDRLELITTPER